MFGGAVLYLYTRGKGLYLDELIPEEWVGIEVFAIGCDMTIFAKILSNYANRQLSKRQ